MNILETYGYKFAGNRIQAENAGSIIQVSFMCVGLLLPIQLCSVLVVRVNNFKEIIFFCDGNHVKNELFLFL